MLKQGLKIALVQLAVGPDKKRNTANAIVEIYKAKAQGAQLVVLSECFNSPIGSKCAEEVPTGETCQALSKAATEAGVCVIAGTMTERSGNNLYNTCTAWDVDGKLLAKHRKIENSIGIESRNKIRIDIGIESETVVAIDNETGSTEFKKRIAIGSKAAPGSKQENGTGDGIKRETRIGIMMNAKSFVDVKGLHLYDINVPGKIIFKESSIRSAGDKLTTFDFKDIKIGLGICYDLRFQEIAQLMADQGAFGMKMGPLHWELLGRARAVDQQLWVALVSPARDTNADYVAWGHTTLINPWGTVVGKLDEKPGMLINDIGTLRGNGIASGMERKSRARTGTEIENGTGAYTKSPIRIVIKSVTLGVRSLNQHKCKFNGRTMIACAAGSRETGSVCFELVGEGRGGGNSISCR
ncbi:Omega-amidase NIT2 [Eumeta japonica]|uniref:omega-amidase n=1 Tax=Eumeta variegata TaxID=151549 RepID=A0A4C1YZZ2_EUMVA|nr:Omega-amidase NIT2 [Eumeta japonica]